MRTDLLVQYIFVCLWQVLVEREDTKEGGKLNTSDDFENLIPKHLPSSDLKLVHCCTLSLCYLVGQLTNLKSNGRNDEMRLAWCNLVLFQSFTHSLLLLTKTMEKQID